MKKVILSLVVVFAVVVIVAGGLFAVYGIDDWREEIAAEASDALGRTVTLAGPVTLEFGSPATIRMHDIRIANKTAGKAPVFARVSELEARFDPITFLGDDPVIERVVVKGIELALEQGADGQNNWSFGRMRTGGRTPNR